MFQKFRQLFLRFMSTFDNIPEEDHIKFSNLQKSMLESDESWEVTYLEYCWRLNSAKHYVD
jgi:hypothetical protein